MLGQYDIEFFKLEPTKPGFRNGYSKNKKVALHTFSEKSKSKAMQEADRYIFEHFRNRVSLIQQNAEWRTAKPSDKQIALLRKFGYQNADQLSK